LTHTLAPIDASLSDMALPMSLAPPVTIAAFPFNIMILFFLTMNERQETGDLRYEILELLN